MLSIAPNTTPIQSISGSDAPIVPQDQQPVVVVQNQGNSSGMLSGLSSIFSKVGDGLSYVGSGILSGGEMALNGASYVGSGIVSGGQMALEGVKSGAQMVGSGIVSGGEMALNGASYVGSGIISGGQMALEGVKSGAEMVGSGIVSGGKMALDGASYVGSGVLTGGKMVVDGAVYVGSGVKSVAVTGTTMGVEKGGGTVLATLSGILAKGISLTGKDTSTLTILGNLPNAPGFGSASTQGATELSERYEGIRTSDETPGTTRQVLTDLNQAFTTAQTQSRHGSPTTLNQEQFHAVLARGGHFVVTDGGALCNQLRQSGGEGFVERGSSHYKGSGHAQYGMDLPGGLGHLLIGRTNSGDTFFQLESHGTGGGAHSVGEKLKDLAGHTQSYFQHIGSSSSYVQLGPQGCIEGSEKDNNHVILTPQG